MNEQSFGIEPELTIKLQKKVILFMRYLYLIEEDHMMKGKKLALKMRS